MPEDDGWGEVEAGFNDLVSQIESEGYESYPLELPSNLGQDLIPSTSIPFSIFGKGSEADEKNEIFSNMPGMSTAQALAGISGLAPAVTSEKSESGGILGVLKSVGSYLLKGLSAGATQAAKSASSGISSGITSTSGFDATSSTVKSVLKKYAVPLVALAVLVILGAVLIFRRSK